MPNITAILLAAGKSRRMGSSKPLLQLDNKPVILWCLDALFAAGLKDIIVVLGPGGDQLAEQIKEYHVRIVWNTAPESDMADSVKEGLKAREDNTRSVLVLPVDHPLVAAETIRQIVTARTEWPEKIIIPTHQGRKGHPTLFPGRVIDELFSSPTLRDIVHRDPQRVHLLGVDDEGILLNMNTPDDHRRIEEKMGFRLSKGLDGRPQGQ